jgi:ASC-1-like (ASCH) protein
MKIFCVVDTGTSELLSNIKGQLSRAGNRVYGSRAEEIDQAAKGYDRLCEALIIDNVIKAVLIYKKHVREEGAVFEVKTCFLFNSSSMLIDETKSIFATLIERVKFIANQRGAMAIKCPIFSQNVEEIQPIIQEGGFTIIKPSEPSKCGDMTKYTLEMTLNVTTSARRKPARVEEFAIADGSATERSELKKSSVSVEPIEGAARGIANLGGHYGGMMTISHREEERCLNLTSITDNVRPSVKRKLEVLDTSQEEAPKVLRSNIDSISRVPSTHFASSSQRIFPGSTLKSNKADLSRSVSAPPRNNDLNVEFSGHHHSCTLRNQYINAINSRQKTYEGRINYGPFLRYKTGDTAVWFTGQQKVDTLVTDRRTYPTFQAMLEDIGFKNMVPEARTLQEAVKLYEAIPGYLEKSRIHGVVALGIRPLTQDEISRRNAITEFRSSGGYRR